MAPAELKAEAETRVIEGYAATFGNVDLVDDVIDPGAFTKTISEQGNKENRIKVFLWHREPIGMPIEMREDERGLFTRSRITKTEAGDKALAWVKDGIASHMSIGFDVIKSEEKARDDQKIRHIKEVKLWEYGPVVWPANPQAVITSVKSVGMEMIRSTFGLLPLLKNYMAAQGESLTDTEAMLLETVCKEMEGISADLRKMIINHLAGTRESEPRATTPEPGGDEPTESVEPGHKGTTLQMTDDEVEAVHSVVLQLKRQLTNT